MALVRDEYLGDDNEGILHEIVTRHRPEFVANHFLTEGAGNIVSHRLDPEKVDADLKLLEMLAFKGLLDIEPEGKQERTFRFDITRLGIEHHNKHCKICF